MSQFRLFAKAVAIFDLVISAFSMLAVIVLVILLTKDQIQQFSDLEHLNATAAWVLWVVVAICAILTALQMWAAIRLLSATKIDQQPAEALRLASTWRNVSIVFLVLESIRLLGSGMYIWFAINLVLRGVMIYIVFRYMQELKSTSYVKM